MKESLKALWRQKAYRRFAEMCDACRRARVVGLGYGPPSTGKTESATYYAQWNLFKPFLPEPLITFTGRSAVDGLYPYRPLAFTSAPLDASIQQYRTVFCTPPVTGAPGRIEVEKVFCRALRSRKASHIALI